MNHAQVRQLVQEVQELRAHNAKLALLLSVVAMHMRDEIQLETPKGPATKPLLARQVSEDGNSCRVLIPAPLVEAMQEAPYRLRTEVKQYPERPEIRHVVVYVEPEPETPNIVIAQNISGAVAAALKTPRP